MRYELGIVATAAVSAVLFALAEGGSLHHQAVAYCAGAIEGAMFGAVFGGLLTLAARLGLTVSWMTDVLVSGCLMVVFALTGAFLLRVEVMGVALSLANLDRSDIVHLLLFGSVFGAAFAVGARPMPANWRDYLRIRLTSRRR